MTRVSSGCHCRLGLLRHKARQAEERLLLGSAYKDNDLVFCWQDGRPIDPRYLNDFFEKILQRAGLPSVRLHDLRHTFATLMLYMHRLLFRLFSLALKQREHLVPHRLVIAQIVT